MMAFKCNQLSEAIKRRNEEHLSYNDIQLRYFDTFPFGRLQRIKDLCVKLNFRIQCKHSACQGKYSTDSEMIA